MTPKQPILGTAIGVGFIGIGGPLLVLVGLLVLTTLPPSETADRSLIERRFGFSIPEQGSMLIQRTRSRGRWLNDGRVTPEDQTIRCVVARLQPERFQLFEAHPFELQRRPEHELSCWYGLPNKPSPRGCASLINEAQTTGVRVRQLGAFCQANDAGLVYSVAEERLAVFEVHDGPR